MTLRVPCEHGKWDAHGFDSEFCHGGREPTVEEVTQWLVAQDELTYTFECNACITAWPHKEHSKTVWLDTSLTEAQCEELWKATL